MRKLTLLMALLIITAATHADDIRIRSGVNTNYCVPFDDPRCQAFNTQENSRLVERRQLEQRLNKLELERQRNLNPTYSEHEPRRDRYHDERTYR